MICSLSIREEERPSLLEVVLISGDTAEEALLRKTKDALRPKRIVFNWGMNECAPLMGFCGNEPALEFLDGLVGAGRALMGTYVKISETGTERAVMRGETGGLHVSSQALIRSYLGGVNHGDFYKDAEGRRWFKTGDVAMIMENGVVFVVWRTKDVIECKGIGIVPSIMEHSLNEFFSVEVSPLEPSRWIYTDTVLPQSQVLGVPHEAYGAIPNRSRC
jgi:acyl-CoA synthetase (AMP-forming)/AMP-acid ligase II